MLIEKLDAVCATSLHSSGSVLATSSGQQHFSPGGHAKSDDEDSKEDDDDGGEVEGLYDDSLKLWGL